MNAQQKTNRVRLTAAELLSGPQQGTIVRTPSTGEHYEPNREKTQSNIPCESFVGAQRAAPKVRPGVMIKMAFLPAFSALSGDWGQMQG